MVEFLRLSRQRQRRFRVFGFSGFFLVSVSAVTSSTTLGFHFPPSPTPRGARASRARRTREPSLTLFFFFTPSSYTQRVYYVREDIMKRATSVARDQLVSLGVCVGKFTHSDKFRLTIGALELLAAHAKHKVRIATGEADASRSFALFFRRYARRMRLVRSSRRCFSFASAPRSSRRPVMRRISVFNLNLCDEKRLILRALEG